MMVRVALKALALLLLPSTLAGPTPSHISFGLDHEVPQLAKKQETHGYMSVGYYVRRSLTALVACTH
jgi:hypothetical protein